MKNEKALAFVNMYGILGALENLCVLDSKAKEILKEIKKPVALCFDVKDGPCRTFHFDKKKFKVTKNTIVMAWILRHPAKMQPLTGTMNPERLLECAAAADIIITKQEWYEIFSSAGNVIP